MPGNKKSSRNVILGRGYMAKIRTIVVAASTLREISKSLRLPILTLYE